MSREEQRARLSANRDRLALPIRKVLPTSGDEIWVRQMTIAMALAGDGVERTKNEQFARNMAQRICDEDGEPILDVAVPGDIKLILGQDVTWLSEVRDVIAEVDGLGKPSIPTESS